MARFLPSPVFAFTQIVIDWFDGHTESVNEHTGRVLMKSIPDGVYFRNLDDTLTATIEISGALVIVNISEDGVVKDTIWFAEDEVDRYCEVVLNHYL